MWSLAHEVPGLGSWNMRLYLVPLMPYKPCNFECKRLAGRKAYKMDKTVRFRKLSLLTTEAKRTINSTISDWWQSWDCKSGRIESIVHQGRSKFPSQGIEVYLGQKICLSWLLRSLEMSWAHLWRHSSRRHPSCGVLRQGRSCRGLMSRMLNPGEMATSALFLYLTHFWNSTICKAKLCEMHYPPNKPDACLSSVTSPTLYSKYNQGMLTTTFRLWGYLM